MQDILLLLGALEQGIPFSFAHINDGEVTALHCKEGRSTAKKKQPCSKPLQLAMHQAIQHRASNFYLGAICPCSFSFGENLLLFAELNVTYQGQVTRDSKCPLAPPRLTFPQIINDDQSLLADRLTVGNVFSSGNYAYAKSELSRILVDITKHSARSIHIVAGASCSKTTYMYSTFDPRAQRFEDSAVFPFPVKSYHPIASRNAFWYNYQEMRNMSFLRQHAKVRPDDVVLLLAGPLGRILASEWAHLQPSASFLDLGSMWDAELCGGRQAQPVDMSDTEEDCMYVGDKGCKGSVKTCEPLVGIT